MFKLLILISVISISSSVYFPLNYNRWCIIEDEKCFNTSLKGICRMEQCHVLGRYFVTSEPCESRSVCHAKLKICNKIKMFGKCISLSNGRGGCVDKYDKVHLNDGC
jgi:hypothetical protein